MRPQQRSPMNTLASALMAAACVLVFSACSGGGDPGPGSAGVSASATVTGTAAGGAPLTVSFNGGGSKGKITSYEWSFNDNGPKATGSVVSRTFTEPGIYTVRLTVTDIDGARSSSTVQVTVTGSSSGGDTSGGAMCTTAPAQFTSTVWPALNTSCVLCHSAGQVAGGTRLVFVPGGGDVLNYNQLRTFARSNGDLLLSKSIGQPSHVGGSPFGNSSSPQYTALAALVPVMQQPCDGGGSSSGSSGGGTVTASAFWNGVGFLDNSATLTKAAMMFASRNPTNAELDAVAAGGTPALRATIRNYMQGAAFDRFLDEVGDTQFLPQGVVVYGNNMGLNATDYPAEADLINGATGFPSDIRTRFQSSVQREGVELLKYIVRGDQPWTDMVAGNYTVMSGMIARFMAPSVQGPFNNADDDTEWRRGTWKSERLGGTREHAGVLSTHAWLQRFPTTDTNRNRHRVFIMAKQFLGTDMAALAARPIDDGAGKFLVPWIENPDCNVCHNIIDPMAAGFQNWNERNRFLPNRDSSGVDHALPSTYRSSAYPKNAAGQPYYKVGDNWFRDAVNPGYNGTPMPGGFTGNKTALQWLGNQVAADARFARGAVQFWYQGLFGREPLAQPTDASSPSYAGLLAAYNAQQDEFGQIAARFATDRGNGAYNVKDLLVDLAMSRSFRANSVVAADMTPTRTLELSDVGSLKLLTPAHLQRKLIALVGLGYNGFNNPYAGEGLNYGNFNGNDRVTRAKDYTMMQTTTFDRVAASRSCAIVQTDFGKPVGSRLLFPLVTLTQTPATTGGPEAIVENIRYLHKWLLKEDLPATDAEIQRTYKLFADVWADRATAPARPTSCAFNNSNDPNYTGRAWSTVVAYLLGDPKFLFE